MLWGYAITASGELPFLKDHTACLFEERRVIIFGGETSGKNISNEVFILDIDDEGGMPPMHNNDLTVLLEFTIRSSVQKTYNSETVGRVRHSTILYKHFMYVFGGYDVKDKRSDDLWQLNLSIKLIYKSGLILISCRLFRMDTLQTFW